MKVVAFIAPPQGDVIEKILRHCGLWHRSSPCAACCPCVGSQPGRPCGPRDGILQRDAGTDLRGHRHVRGDILIGSRRPSNRGRYAQGCAIRRESPTSLARKLPSKAPNKTPRVLREQAGRGVRGVTAMAVTPLLTRLIHQSSRLDSLLSSEPELAIIHWPPVSPAAGNSKANASASASTPTTQMLSAEAAGKKGKRQWPASTLTSTAN